LEGTKQRQFSAQRNPQQKADAPTYEAVVFELCRYRARVVSQRTLEASCSSALNARLQSSTVSAPVTNCTRTAALGRGSG